MSEEFGTVSAKKGDRAREIARLREHYRGHRETLTGLMGDAPSDHLATEYQRLIGEIDAAVKKLDELDGKPATAPPPLPADTNPTLRPKTRPGATAPGNRPLSRTEEPVGAVNPQSRVAVIVVAGLVVIAAIAALIWYASSRRHPSTKPAIVTEPSTTTQTAVTTIAPASPPSSIKVTPSLADYGTIRKGTRAVRQFEVVNGSAAPIEIQVQRSNCRCLFYDYKAKLTPNGKETITVTIDGARAKAGQLSEHVDVTAKGDSSLNATFTVQANIH